MRTERAAPRRAPRRSWPRSTATSCDRAGGGTIIAGYPWFTDWGRDTFIALRGLCLATGRLDEAEAILPDWAGTVARGHAAQPLSRRGRRARVQLGGRLALVRRRRARIPARPRRGRPCRPAEARGARAAVDGDPRRATRAARATASRSTTDGLLRPACRACSSPGWTPRSATGSSRRASASRSRSRRCGSTRCAIAGRLGSSTRWRRLRARARTRPSRARFWNPDGGLPLRRGRRRPRARAPPTPRSGPTRSSRSAACPFPLLEGERGARRGRPRSSASC